MTNKTKFFANIINEIDIKAERVLAELNVSQEEKSKVNSSRNLFISTLKQIKLENKTDSGLNMFCYFIPNEMKEHMSEISMETKCYFKFDNKLGKLVLFNQFIKPEVFDDVCDVINENVKLNDRDFHSFQDYAKCVVMVKILDEKFKESTPIIDMSDLTQNSLTTLNISSHKFNDILSEDFEFLPYFINFFSNFKNLIDLEFRESKIEILTSNCFLGLSNLRILSISNARLKHFDKDAFVDLKNLKKLSLPHNFLCEIKSEMLNGLENLEELNLSENELRKINFKGMKNLKNLDLSNNKWKINVDSNCFENCSQIRILCLQNSLIGTLPPNVFNDSKYLSYLNLKGNTLDNFDFLIHLNYLEFLNISCKTNFSYKLLNDIIFKSLKYLVIETERVGVFGENLNNLQALEINGVSNFEGGSLKNLKSLEFLALNIQNDSIIEQLDETFFIGLNNLKYLAIKTWSFGHSSIEKFRNKENLFLSLFVKSSENLKSQTFYDDDDVSYSLVTEIKTIESEIFFVEKILHVSKDVRDEIFKFKTFNPRMDKILDDFVFLNR
ncbi:unnamed protein product [Brachionus calyciflorus]|uniref:Uncharacterized protein n=1 Tax=Brachionus calyciflorus TaxID=104777 RepID=A0A814GRM4_9BILA|nr:unnamed protein product [Brachionus calyciflorus]